MASILAPSSILQAQVAKVSYHPKKKLIYYDVQYVLQLKSFAIASEHSRMAYLITQSTAKGRFTDLLHAQYCLSPAQWCGASLHNPSYASPRTVPKLRCFQAEKG